MNKNMNSPMEKTFPINRRRFFRHSAVLGAAIAAGPVVVRAAESTSPAKKIKVTEEDNAMVLLDHGNGVLMLANDGLNPCKNACPGWSFHQHAADPRKDSGVQRNVAKADAPYWTATEWLLQGTREIAA